MANGDWTHARLRLERTEGGTLLTIELTPAGGGAVVAVEDYFLPGFDLEAGRLLLSASQGANTSNQDIDNIDVAMTPAAEPVPAVVFGEAATGTIEIGRTPVWTPG